MPAKEAASGIRVSEKTVRAIYWRLREALLPTIFADRKAFGGAGRFLIRDHGLSDTGRSFVAVIAESDVFTTHLKRHCPRLNAPERYQQVLIEVVVRIFCNIAMPKETDVLYPEETREALRTMREIAAWIKNNRDTEAAREVYASVVSRFGRVVAALPALLALDQLLSLRDKSTAHHFPDTVFYDHLRRHLANHPL